jgi:hypothetical protein
VVTRLSNNSGAVFSVLRGPSRGNIRESNFETISSMSTEEYSGVHQRVRESELRSVVSGYSHGKFVVEEELEVGL